MYLGHGGLTPVQDLAYTTPDLEPGPRSHFSRNRPPSSRALSTAALPDRIRGAGDVQLCTGDLCQALSEAEAHDTRALFVPGDGVPSCPTSRA